MKPNEKVEAILHNIWRLSKEELYQDLSIVCKDGIIRTNSLFLSLQSPVINKLLNEIPREEDLCIFLPDIFSHQLHGFLENVSERRSFTNTSVISLLLPTIKAELPPTKNEVKSNNTFKRDEENIKKSDSIDNFKEEILFDSDQESDPDFEELDPLDGAGEQSGDDQQHIQTKSYMKECLICEISLKNKLEYSNHMNVHRKSFVPHENPSCPNCGKNTYKCFESFYRHVRKCVPPSKPEPCWLCQATFESKAEYSEHMKSHKEKFLTPVCQHCGKKPALRENTPQHFRRHVEVCRRKKEAEAEGFKHCHYCHTKLPIDLWKEHSRVCIKKPSKKMCNICGKEYTNLKLHTKEAHELLPLQPNTAFCDICGKGFLKKGQLMAHLKSHEEALPCPHCGIKVKHLDIHIATVHLPDKLKSHQCQDCGKGFKNISKLKVHQMNMHLKLRPYRCRYGCEDSYNDTSNRNQHEKKKHGQLFIRGSEEKKRRRLEENHIKTG